VDYQDRTFCCFRYLSSNTSTSICNEEDKEESNEPDYDEDQAQLEEEQEEQTGETTINQVY
jgi:hypothetical protein